MGSSFLKNVLGFSLNEHEFEDIPYPAFELTFHVTLKDIQAFGILGTGILGPLVALIRSSTRNTKDIIRSSTKYGRYGVIAGLFVGPMMTYGRMKSINADEGAIYDRCYRLRYNRNQVRVDMGSIYGAASGLVLFPLVLKMCPIFGSLVGMSTGVISMGIYNKNLADN